MAGYLVKTANFVAEIKSDEELKHLAEVDTIQKDTKICVLPGQSWIEAKKIPILRRVWGLEGGAVPPPIKRLVKDSNEVQISPMKTSLPPRLETVIDANPFFATEASAEDDEDSSATKLDRRDSHEFLKATTASELQPISPAIVMPVDETPTETRQRDLETVAKAKSSALHSALDMAVSHTSSTNDVIEGDGACDDEDETHAIVREETLPTPPAEALAVKDHSTPESFLTENTSVDKSHSQLERLEDLNAILTSERELSELVEIDDSFENEETHVIDMARVRRPHVDESAGHEDKFNLDDEFEIELDGEDSEHPMSSFASVEVLNDVQSSRHQTPYKTGKTEHQMRIDGEDERDRAVERVPSRTFDRPRETMSMTSRAYSNDLNAQALENGGEHADSTPYVETTKVKNIDVMALTCRDDDEVPAPLSSSYPADLCDQEPTLDVSGAVKPSRIRKKSKSDVQEVSETPSREPLDSVETTDYDDISKTNLERAVSLVDALEVAYSQSFDRELNALKVETTDEGTSNDAFEESSDENASDIFRFRNRKELLENLQKDAKDQCDDSRSSESLKAHAAEDSRKNDNLDADDDSSSSDRFKIRGGSELRRMLAAEAKAARDHVPVAATLSTVNYSQSSKSELRNLFEKEDELHLFLESEIRSQEIDIVDENVENPVKSASSVASCVSCPLSDPITDALPVRAESVVAPAPQKKRVENTVITRSPVPPQTIGIHAGFKHPFFEGKLHEGEEKIAQFGNLYLTSQRLWMLDFHKNEIQNYECYDVENIQSIGIKEIKKWFILIADLSVIGIMALLWLWLDQNYICLALMVYGIVMLPVAYFVSFNTAIQFGYAGNIIRSDYAITRDNRTEALEFLNKLDNVRHERRLGGVSL